MRTFTCDTCGTRQRANHYIETCSTCGEHGLDPVVCEYDLWAAEEGCEVAIIRLWQAGERLTSVQQSRLDEILHSNRVEMLSTVYECRAA